MVRIVGSGHEFQADVESAEDEQQQQQRPAVFSERPGLVWLGGLQLVLFGSRSVAGRGDEIFDGGRSRDPDLRRPDKEHPSTYPGGWLVPRDHRRFETVDTKIVQTMTPLSSVQ